ncbi:hypothetical protein RAJCM14343_1816 [Rhodococcus aetherivorans]|uniref:Uncharacterized protein n=1 Tax=Rhodococcus aetherivorans TaxID=191292 RepID=A0ABQ0YJ79_9NOCA|nr:hypothetical protein RAJCM14343_1816 [Rhodococcus aetherivorans]
MHVIERRGQRNARCGGGAGGYGRRARGVGGRASGHEQGSCGQRRHRARQARPGARTRLEVHGELVAIHAARCRSCSRTRRRSCSVSTIVSGDRFRISAPLTLDRPSALSVGGR